jgi:glycosyltransferase involved in cell wall biosynthesis
MEVLIVCSGNKGKINPFILEQASSLEKQGVIISYFTIKGKGIFGYLSNLRRLNSKIKSGKYQVIHAHYGLSGLFAGLQRKIPVVTTFHGSDINRPKVLQYSKIAARLSRHNIVVEESFNKLLGVPGKTSVIPCGIDFFQFKELDTKECRKDSGFGPDENILLFTSSFENKVKNYPLAKAATEKSKNNPRLIELKGYSRKDILRLMNAADALLMTSFTEGSPQVVKEALACRLPVISTPVGDVPYLAKHTDGIRLVPYDAKQIADEIDNTLDNKSRVKNISILEKYDNITISNQIINVFRNVINSYS